MERKKYAESMLYAHALSAADGITDIGDKSVYNWMIDSGATSYMLL